MISLFAGQEREAKLDRIGDPLAVLQAHVDFTALAAEIDRQAPRPPRDKGGRPPFPTELMVRLLILQQMFNLSDDQLEYQVLDRMSFQRFVGLQHSSRVPDAKTVWLFRERLSQAGMGAALFQAVQQQLAGHGYIARCGQIVDATLVQVPTQRNHREENRQIKAGETPADWSPAKRRQKDVQARWTEKHGKQYYGYKLSSSVDRRYKLIRKLCVSSANEHDTRHLETVLDGLNTSRDLYADRGYVNAEREQRLRSQGWRVHIQRKAEAGKPLSACQERRNRRIAKRRARVEHVFAGLAQMGSKTLRCIGLARAEFNLQLKAAVYNLKRLGWLLETKVEAF